MAERRLLIMRHPETEANVTGRWVGSGDTPYTETGRAQADALVREIQAFAPEQVWSSPLSRARVPAEKSAMLLSVPHTIDERLSEMHFGAAEGLTFGEAEERGVAFDFKSVDAPVAQGGESRREILSRTAEAIEDALSDCARVAIVTHGGVFRSALVHLLELPIDAIWAFHIRNAAVAEVVRHEDGHGERWCALEEFRVAR